MKKKPLTNVSYKSISNVIISIFMERYLRVPSVGKGLKRDLTNSFLLWGFAGSVWGAGSNGSSLLFPVVLLSEKNSKKLQNFI